jgi:hypothetical protein
MYCHQKSNPAQTTNTQAIAMIDFQRMLTTALDYLKGFIAGSLPRIGR